MRDGSEQSDGIPGRRWSSEQACPELDLIPITPLGSEPRRSDANALARFAVASHHASIVPSPKGCWEGRRGIRSHQSTYPRSLRCWAIAASSSLVSEGPAAGSSLIFTARGGESLGAIQGIRVPSMCSGGSIPR